MEVKQKIKPQTSGNKTSILHHKGKQEKIFHHKGKLKKCTTPQTKGIKTNILHRKKREIKQKYVKPQTNGNTYVSL